MRIRYTLRAFADREAIFDYIEQHSPQGALNVMRAIENSIARLEHFPYSAPATDEPDLWIDRARATVKGVLPDSEGRGVDRSHSPHVAPAVERDRRLA